MDESEGQETPETRFGWPDWGADLDEATGFAAQALREGFNDREYNGSAPHDSNALSEVWPTAGGAGFSFWLEGVTFIVEVRRERSPS